MKKSLILIIISCFSFTLLSCSQNTNNAQNSLQKSNITLVSPKEETKTNEPVSNEKAVSPTESEKKPEVQQPITPKTQENVVLSASNLSNEKKSWWFKPNSTHTVPSAAETSNWLTKYNATYLGDTNKKVIYLTFDEGNVKCYSSSILDTLKKHSVQATFFLTKPYIDANPNLVKRMVAEGHKLGNHTNTHPSMPTLASDQTKFKYQLYSTNEAFKKATGRDLDPIFRFPFGEYSERTLGYVKDMGYKTYFWSFAYNDYTPSEPPSYDFSKNKLLTAAHNGEIILLHASCKTNADVLDEVITTLKSQGYSFSGL